MSKANKAMKNGMKNEMGLSASVSAIVSGSFAEIVAGNVASEKKMESGNIPLDSWVGL